MLNMLRLRTASVAASRLKYQSSPLNESAIAQTCCALIRTTMSTSLVNRGSP